MPPDRSHALRFVLTGFTQDVGFRVFAFERIAENRVRIACTVRADLALSRRYGIQVQELPLLCRGLLERCGDGEPKGALTFTEEEMRSYMMGRRAAQDAAAQKRKPPRRPAGNSAGAAWRSPHS
ncbi:MAG TPA: hypothetical protein VMU80_24060 [Bryobacteraceae bacterium]|nr:hypothetical protein [Bryobacteraceae bacterium]HUO32312.1 hypothetical protein [Bryobacteraceae bacterium]